MSVLKTPAWAKNNGRLHCHGRCSVPPEPCRDCGRRVRYRWWLGRLGLVCRSCLKKRGYHLPYTENARLREEK